MDDNYKRDLVKANERSAHTARIARRAGRDARRRRCRRCGPAVIVQARADVWTRAIVAGIVKKGLGL